MPSDPLALLGVSGDDDDGVSGALSMGIVGDDDESGARRRHHAKKHVLKTLQTHAVMTKMPQINIGVDSEPQAAGGIAAGGTLVIPVQPSVPVQITEFEVASSCAPFFQINSIKTARMDLLGGSLSVPAESYLPNSRHPPIENPVVSGGSQISISVTNIDAAAQRFRAVLWGIDLTPALSRMSGFVR